jgi:hypothetical protein
MDFSEKKLNNFPPGKELQEAMDQAVFVASEASADKSSALMLQNQAMTALKALEDQMQTDLQAR